MSLSVLSCVRSWFDKETPLPGGGIVAGSTTDAPDLNVDNDVLLDGIGLPAFVLNEQGHIVVWNADVESLTGTSAADAPSRRDPDKTFYGSAATRVFARQVLDNPHDAASLNDVELDDPDRLLYAMEETFANANGDDCHARHATMPLYEGDELVNVLQTVHNRTTGVERHRETATLVSEVESTLTQLSQENLDARATIDDNRAVDDQLYLVIGAVNETARNLSTLASSIENETKTATAAVMWVVSAADTIIESAGEQRDLLDEDATRMQQFNAAMEEIAATADKVDTVAAEARQATAEGHEANSEAREATESIVTMGDELVDHVTELGDRMDDIEAIVEVISEVAGQTNLFALNANIEAARAGGDGDGFATAAEEVKSLADETRQHTEDITIQIENIQPQTDEMVHAATESNDRVEHVDEHIFEMLVAFKEITASIDTATGGTAEVSRTTDEQAEAVEELAATIEDVRNWTVETEGAVDGIIAATDESTQALSSLATEVEGLTGSRSA